MEKTRRFAREEIGMSKRKKVLTIIVLALFLCCAAASILSFTVKPDLYYPIIMREEDSAYLMWGGDKAYLSDFEGKFNMVCAIDLLPNGNCSAGTNDFVILQTDNGEAIIPVAEKLALQGAKVLLLDSYVNPDGVRFTGKLCYKSWDEIKTTQLSGNTKAEIAEELHSLAYRMPKIVFTTAACVLLVCLLVLFATALRKHTAVSGSGEDAADARAVLSSSRYRISLACAVLLLLLNCAWLIAPNLYFLFEKYFDKAVLIASLVSLPFLAFSLIALLNLTRFRKFRRWINIICLVFTGIAVAIILFSLIMMLFT